MSYIQVKNINELSHLSLTGITEHSLDRIHQYRDLLFPLVNTIVDELYDKIYVETTLKKIIDKYSTLQKLKVTQRRYLTEVFSPIIDDAYLKTRYMIGKTHSRVGLGLNWYISTSQQYYLIISSHLNRLLPADEALELSNSILSVLNFDMQIVTSAYNKIEVNKAEFPLRYEFQHLQKKTGLSDKDLEILTKYSGLFTFRLPEVLKQYENLLMQRFSLDPIDKQEVIKFFSYLHRFFLQFFQEKVYYDEGVYYRIIRDWVAYIVNKNISEQKLTAIVDALNEVIREVFFIKEGNTDHHYLFVTSFERLSRFTLAIMHELLIPYKSLKDYQFLQIYSYEIDKVDFGLVTWVDENTVRLLQSRGIKKKEMIGKRCFQLFYDRIFPCAGCPIRDDRSTAYLNTYGEGTIKSYYKTWQLPQSKMGGISHSLLISQDVTQESNVIFDTIESLLELAELRDDMTGTHVERIGLLSSKLAQLASFDEKFIENIQLAAKFHDIGKVGIPDFILNKPGKLSEQEWESMKTHPIIGHQILSKLDLPVIQMAARIANFHHEKWNGEGYPNQLKGEEIPVEGRIVAIVDVFDALLTKRAYKDPIPQEKVKEIMLEGRGTHFDPNLLDLFISMWSEFCDFHQKIEESTSILV